MNEEITQEVNDTESSKGRTTGPLPENDGSIPSSVKNPHSKTKEPKLWWRWRYRNTPEVRAKNIEKNRKRYWGMTNEERVERNKLYTAKKKERYQKDPVFREAHKARVIVSRRRHLANHKKIMTELRANGCVVCGEKCEACLDFHHKDPSKKEFNISHANAYRIHEEDVRREVSKCVVLCSNCHRKFHAGIISLED